MSKTIYSFEKLCCDLSQQCLQQTMPENVYFFGMLWDIMRKRMFTNGIPVSPERWGIELLQENIPKDIRLAGETEHKVPVSIVSALCAVMASLALSENRSKKIIDELILKYTNEFGTPKWAMPHIRALVEKSVEDIPHHIGKKKTSYKPFLIWRNGKGPVGGTSKDVNNLRQDALGEVLDIFANDAEPGELLVFGKPSTLTVGESFSWSTLTALLERVGSRWTREELFRRVRPNINYKADMHSSLAYDWVKHVKDVLDEDILKSGRKGTEGLVDSWFRTQSRKRVDISRDLRACLIRRNPSVGIH